MRISPIQMMDLSAEEMKEFALRNVHRLRHHFVELSSWSNSELLDLIRKSIHRAEEYGLDNDYDITLFIGAVAQLGQDFDRNGTCPWASDILTNKIMDPCTKMACLYVHIIDNYKSRT